MAIGIAEYGEREFTCNFSWDSNEIHRKIYVKDFRRIKATLDVLFGDNTNPSLKSFTPHQLPPPFDSFVVWGVAIQPIHQKSTQGSDERIGNAINIKEMLDEIPQIRGGVILDITYKPLDHKVDTNEESADYSAQVMTILSNAISQLNNSDGNENAVMWSTGHMVTNLSGIIKVIPKVELIQRKLFLKSPPTTDQVALIGCINESGMQFLNNGGIGERYWPKGTLMLSGMPTVRRWRYDGVPVFEVTVKMSANMYKDQVLGTGGGVSIDYVTWNRLFRVDKGYWDKVIFPKTNTEMYREADLNFVNFLSD